jgi:uncharacterized protein
MYKRILPLTELLKKRSLFLLGPRQTGKSTLLRTLFPEAAFIDLLEADTYREFSARPETLRQRLLPKQKILIVDEIQKLPSLLDEVQLVIDRNKELRVILTGSSVRKLKRGSANLLGGRAWMCRLFPLVTPELGEARLVDRLNHGSLPSVIDSSDPREDLKAYVGTYLHEEIRAEGLARSIENFSRFLEVAGLSNGEQINFTSVGNDSGVPPRTIREHYQILEDTLIGHMLPSFQKTTKRKPVATAKFFFFDIGVANVLAKIGGIEPGSKAWGNALEHLIFLEIKTYLDYRRSDKVMSFWRSTSQMEVDFIVGDDVAIEVKSTNHVTARDLRGLRALKEEIKLKRSVVVSGERHARRLEDGIEIIPVTQFLSELWEGGII